MKCPKCRADNLSDSRYCRACAAPLAGTEKKPVVPTETIEIQPPALIGGALFAGRYQVVEELGRGGMGVVYRAFDNRLKEEVALKVIRPEIAADGKALERFSTELKLARRLNHRNICRMYELMEHEDVRFISMEYVPGEDLRSFIKRARRLDIGAAVAIGIQIGEGLSEAHRQGVVHRDLKPGNVMIDREGNAKIMDFGIARSRAEKGITAEGRMIGTPEYISPEQIDGAAADAQSDLYALGVILYEMVCGTFPFEGDTAHIIAQKIHGRKPPDPKSVNPHVPDALAKAILRCLEKDRGRRFKEASDLLAELRRIEDDLPTTERIAVRAKSSLFKGITRQLQKRKALGAALALAAVAAVFIFALRPKPAERSAAPAPPSKPTLAVLFFANRTNDPGLDYWRQTLCIKFISFIQQLSPDLAVCNPLAIYSLLKKLRLESGEYSAEDIAKIGETLPATHALTGHLMKAGNDWQIYYELMDVKSLGTARSGQKTGKPDDIEAMIEDLAGRVLRGLGIPVRGTVREPGSRSAVAKQLYAQARDAEINAVLSSEKSDRDALLTRMSRKFQEAIEADSGFAEAYWGLGDYYGLLYVQSSDLQDLNRMRENYELAYRLNPQLAGANAGLGWAYFYDEEMEDAYRFFTNAHRLEPDEPEINANVGSFLFSVGQIEAGIRYFTKAVESGGASANPMGPLYRRVISYVNIGRLAEAERDVRWMISLESQDVSLRILHARILARMRKTDEAEQELALVESLNPSHPDLPYVRAYLLSAAGDKVRALPILEQAKKENPLYRSYFLSENYAELGMADEAVAVIRNGIEKGFSKVFYFLYPYQVLTSGAYQKILRDPRFQGILATQKKKNDEQVAKYRELCEFAPDR